MIPCHNWWPWKKPGYITMTQRQSNNQWSGSIAAHPAQKNFKCKNRLEKFSPRFFGIKTVFSSLIIFQRAKLSMLSITHLCWCNCRIFFLRRTLREGHQGGLVLTRQCPSSPGTCNPDETGLPGLPMSWLPILFSQHGPIRLPSVPWTEKNNWEVVIFHLTWSSLLPQRPCWTDYLQNFFWVTCKSYSNRLRSWLSFVGSTVIPWLMKIIRSGITFVSRNMIQTEKISSWNGLTIHVCCLMLARASTKTFISRVRKTAKKSSLTEKFISRVTR